MGLDRMRCDFTYDKVIETFQDYELKCIQMYTGRVRINGPGPDETVISHTIMKSKYTNILNLCVFILVDPEVTAYINCKSPNLPNTDMQNYSTDLR